MKKIGGICHRCGKCYKGTQCTFCTPPEDKHSPIYGDVYTDIVHNERWSRNLGVHPTQLTDPKEREHLSKIHPGAEFDRRTGKMLIKSRKEKLQRIKERSIATGQTLVEAD